MCSVSGNTEVQIARQLTDIASGSPTTTVWSRTQPKGQPTESCLSRTILMRPEAAPHGAAGCISRTAAMWGEAVLHVNPIQKPIETRFIEAEFTVYIQPVDKSHPCFYAPNSKLKPYI
jgi:hypothetical protein